MCELMKKILCTKRLATVLLLVSLVIIPSIKGAAQCWLSQLASDLGSNVASQEFKAFIKSGDGAFDAYRIFVDAQGISSVLRNDAAVLNTVSELRKDSKFIESIGGEAGLKKLTNDFAPLYSSLTTAAAKNNLIALTKANKDVEILSTVKGWSKEIQQEFYAGLMNKPGNVKTQSFLADRLKDIDSEMLDYYKKFTEKGLVPNKKYDFEFLYGCKGKTDAEIIEFLEQDTRALKAASIASTYPKVAELLTVSNYRSNVLKSIGKLFTENGPALDNFINIYIKDSPTHKLLTDLKGKSASEIKSGLETIFNGIDFNAHHIIPVNMLYNSNSCTDIVEWALKQVPPKGFKFHDMDNLIFLRDINHTNGAFGHNAYDKLIKKELDALEEVFDTNPELAYNRMNEIIDKYRNKIVDELIGSIKKLDELK
jgi:hypothetical protein